MRKRSQAEKSVSVRIDEERLEKIRQAAAIEERSMNTFIAKAAGAAAVKVLRENGDDAQ